MREDGQVSNKPYAMRINRHDDQTLSLAFGAFWIGDSDHNQEPTICMGAVRCKPLPAINDPLIAIALNERR